MRSSGPFDRGLAAMRLLAVILLPLVLAACGPEREFSGIWRQTACGDDLSQPDCGGFVYELHIGRYGDRLAGVVVRYVHDRGGFDSFQRPKECGCFLIESGGVADDEGLLFTLYDAVTPRYPQPDTEDGDLGCPRTRLDECAGRRFDIDGDDEALVGVTDCGEEASAERLDIAFERVVGTPRTECYERRGTAP